MSLRTRILGALVGAPPPSSREVRIERDVAVRTPDGVELLTDLYLAASREPLPVILARTPYGRRGLTSSLLPLFAERGYHVVVQSTRGTFGSTGRIDFDREAADGRAAADWIAAQPWSNGELGTFGASYLSFTQWALASTRPPQLKAMAIQVMGAERYPGFYPGGAFALDRALGWSYTVVHQERSGLAAFRARRALEPAFRHLPLIDADTVGIGAPAPFYRSWVEHERRDDPYWAPTNFTAVLSDLEVPVSMVGGWYDVFLPYMLDDYRALRGGGNTVRLRVGPWRHASLQATAFGFRDALAWFDVHLRHKPAPEAPRVQVAVMGGGGWRTLEDWPPPASEQAWFLHPGGALSQDEPPASEPDRFTYDPADPTPAVGGSSLSLNSGPKDNRELERRPDVLTYTTPALDRDLEIIGPVTAVLDFDSSLEHADFFARLCDVDPRGRSTNITDGLIRVGPGASKPVRIDLWPTAHRFRAGHRIRLQVSSGAHPRYARNLGTGEPIATATEMRVAKQAIYHDPRRPSRVILPVVS